MFRKYRSVSRKQKRCLGSSRTVSCIHIERLVHAIEEVGVAIRRVSQPNDPLHVRRSDNCVLGSRGVCLGSTRACSRTEEVSRKHKNRILYTYRTCYPSGRRSWRRHTSCLPAQHPLHVRQPIRQSKHIRQSIRQSTHMRQSMRQSKHVRQSRPDSGHMRQSRPDTRQSIRQSKQSLRRAAKPARRLVSSLLSYRS